MDILNIIIELLNKEELRNYKLIANRSHSGDRKDQLLLDYIRKSGDRFRERTALKKLYGGSGSDENKNKYYRLRNRLLEDLGKSLVLLHWDTSEINRVLHFLALAILYREKQNFQVAHYYARRAEKIARGLDKPELLDLVLGELILLSLQNAEINPEEIILERNENLQTLNRLRQIDNVLAMVNYRMKATQNLGAQDTNIVALLQKTVLEYSNDPAVQQFPQFRFRLYTGVSNLLIQQRDYASLSVYLLNIYDEFVRDGLFNRNNHDTKLQMLTFLINALYKTHNLQASLEWSGRLLEQMKEFNRLYYDKYLFFYLNTQATIYFDQDPERAIRIMGEMLENEIIAKVPQQILYTHLNLALCQYNTGQFRNSIKTLIRMQLLDSYKNTDETLRFRITLFELALRFDLREFDVLEFRVGQCRNEFSELLTTDEFRKERELLSLMTAMEKSDDYTRDPKVQALAREFMEKNQPDETEIFRYRAWLQRNLAMES